MNSTEIKTKLKDIGKILNENESRRKEIQPLLNEAQKTFKNYEEEMLLLGTQWNRLVAEEKTMKLDLAELVGREDLLKKEQEYLAAYEEIEDFYEYMKPLLQKWINHNERKYFVVKPSTSKIIERMKADLEEYSKPYNQPTFAMAELKGLMSSYNSAMREIKKLEVDQPEGKTAQINIISNRIEMYFNQFFSGRVFKDIYINNQK